MQMRTQHYAIKAAAPLLTAKAVRAPLAVLSLCACVAINSASAANLAVAHVTRRAEAERAQNIVRAPLTNLTPQVRNQFILVLMVTTTAAFALSRRLRADRRQAPAIVMVA